MFRAHGKHKSDRRTLKPNISLLLLIFFCHPASEQNENKYLQHSFLRSLLLIHFCCCWWWWSLCISSHCLQLHGCNSWCDGCIQRLCLCVSHSSFSVRKTIYLLSLAIVNQTSVFPCLSIAIILVQKRTKTK